MKRSTSHHALTLAVVTMVLLAGCVAGTDGTGSDARTNKPAPQGSYNGTDGQTATDERTEANDSRTTSKTQGYTDQQLASGDEKPAGGAGFSLPGELVNVSYHRARGVPITVEAGAMAPRAEYLSSNDSVRFPTAMGPDGPMAWETEGFAEFAEWQCGEAALNALRPNYTQPGTFSSGLGEWNTENHSDVRVDPPNATVPSRYHDRMLPKITYRLLRDNGTKTQPNVTFDTYLDRVPRTVNVSVTIDGESADCTLPVFVERQVARITNDSTG